ncbi:winged helix-turn-helix transcriptional regulator [Candidatus Woesearchaeota archaeon]|nr:winged helix-turn-helix transcriptional regulator [Candidatus Woesearchaeota archaeon]
MEMEILEKAGLTRNEIKVYLALLEEGESTSGPLIRKTGINSSKVYESLGRLQKKGLVSYVRKTNRRHFKAADPARLLDYMEEKKRRIDDEKQDVEKLIPQLSSLIGNPQQESQEATIYQGLKGYRTLLENMLNEIRPGGTYVAFASGLLKDILGPYWHVYQKKKKQFGIKSRCLWDQKTKKQRQYLQEYYGTGRFIVSGSFLGPVDIYVYNDKIIQISYSTKPIFAVLIRSKGMAQGYKDLFETIWKTAERI